MNYIFLCCFLFSAAALSTHAVQGNSITTEFPPANASSSPNKTAPHQLNIFSPLAALRSFFTVKAVSSNATNNATNATKHTLDKRDVAVLNASIASDDHNKSETATIEPLTLDVKSENVTINFNSKLPVQDMLPRGVVNSSEESNSTSTIHSKVRRAILNTSLDKANTEHATKNGSLGRAAVTKVRLHETKNATNQNSTASPSIEEVSKKVRRQTDGNDGGNGDGDDTVEESRFRRQSDDGEGRHHKQRPYPPLRPYKQEKTQQVHPYPPPIVTEGLYPQFEMCHSSQPCPCGMNKCKMPCRKLIYNAPPQRFPQSYEQ